MGTTVQSSQLKTQEITLQDVISRLNACVLERRHAYTQLSKTYTCFQPQLEAIKQISLHLADASKTPSQLDALKQIIRTGPLFLYIAPRKTYKLFNTYYGKIDELFRACFEYKERLIAK